MSEPVAAPFPLLPQRPVRRALVIVAAFLALTSCFVCAGFPADRMAPRIATAATAVTGSQVEIGGLDLGLVALLPALHLRDVAVATPGGTRLRLDRVRLRPAWSLSWLRGRPSLVVSLRAGEGHVDGTVRLGPAPGFTGDFEKLDLDLVPASLLADYGLSLDGRVDGALDLQIGEDGGPAGDLKLHATDGSLGLPGLPIGVPFKTIDAEATLGGEQLAKIASLVVDGPMVALNASGTIGQAPAPMLAPLALEGRLEVREPALREMVVDAGVPLGPDGTAELAVGGTLGAPDVGRGRAPRAAPAPGAPRRP